jgi:hypothetical protein
MRTFSRGVAVEPAVSMRTEPVAGPRAEAPRSWPAEPLAPPRPRPANGSAAATILAAGLACGTFGLVTILEHTTTATRQAMTWYEPVGSHSGTTAVTIAVWLLAWLVLDRRWRRAQLQLGRVLAIALALVALGIAGTFPPVYDALGLVGTALAHAVAD